MRDKITTYFSGDKKSTFNNDSKSLEYLKRILKNSGFVEKCNRKNCDFVGTVYVGKNSYATTVDITNLTIKAVNEDTFKKRQIKCNDYDDMTEYFYSDFGKKSFFNF